MALPPHAVPDAAAYASKPVAPDEFSQDEEPAAWEGWEADAISPVEAGSPVGRPSDLSTNPDHLDGLGK